MRIIVITVCALTVLSVRAQDETGLNASVEVTKKINKKVSVGVEAEYRNRNDMRTNDRWTVELSGSYKLTPWLKLSAGYKFMETNTEEKTTYHSDGSANKWRPSFWQPKHRVSVSLTGSHDIGPLSLSLRERWQYTYRPEHDTERWDYDDEAWQQTTIESKASNVLRSRLMAEYNIPKCKVTPFASVELFNGWNLQKVRYQVGARWSISKRHSLSAYYRYQDNKGDNNIHIIGIGYTLKL